MAYDHNDIDKITETCLKLYNSLPKTGKPTDNEWTVLSCIVKHDTKHNTFEVVSLGTGSKCIGASKMSPKGDILNDSHSEVIARRGFLVYLYHNIETALNNRESIFVIEDNKFHLNSGISFHFFSSQLPCGDASIMPKTGDIEHYGDVIVNNKRSASEQINDEECKRRRLTDIHRTGAKCLPNGEQDSKLAGPSYHVCGKVRTKPGRGDRTLSVSCSDKIARWVHMGIQGSFLNMLLAQPIYIKSFVFGAKTPFSEESLTRALLCRNSLILERNLVPKFFQSTLNISELRSDNRSRPSAGSILCINTEKTIHEVAILGKKLGVTKKDRNSMKSALSISKYHIYRKFINILTNHERIKADVAGDVDLSTITYNEMKLKSVAYMEKWKVVKNKFFEMWTVKPDMWNFCICSDTL